MPPKAEPRSSSRLVFAGLCLAGLVAPIVWTEALAASFTLPKLVVLTLAVLCCAVGVAVSWRRSPPGPTPLDLPLAACAAALALSLACSKDPRLGFFGMYNHYAFGVWALMLCAGLYWAAAWEPDLGAREKVLGCALAAGAAIGAYSVLQVAGLDPLLYHIPLPQGRAMATMGSPVHLGAYLALLCPAALQWAMPSGRLRPMRALPWAAITAGIIASGSRGSVAGAAAGCGLFLLFSGRALSTARSRVLAGLLAAALVAGVGARLALRPAVKGGESARVDIWMTAWRSFLEHPLVGSGPDTFEQAFRRLKPLSYTTARSSSEYQANAHNDLLQALATVGLVGLAAYLWLLAALAKMAADRIRSGAAPEAAGLAAGLCAYFITMKSNPMPLEGFALAAVFAGLLCPPPSKPSEGRPALWAPALAVLLALASCAHALRLAAADRREKAGMILLAAGRAEAAQASFSAALKLEDCELTYHIALVNLLSARAAAITLEAPRRELLDLAEGYGRKAVACHPSDMRAHYILGVASLMQARIGMMDRLAVAERELDEALSLDPTLSMLLHSRLEAAQLRGDKALAEALQARFDALPDVRKAP